VSEHGQPTSSPSRRDGEAVRVTARNGASRWAALPYHLLALAVVAAALVYLVQSHAPAGRPANPPADIAGTEAGAARAPRSASTLTARADPARRPGRVAEPVSDLDEEPYHLPSLDPDDLAAHFRPGDPEPSAAELIEALHHAGIHSGIGAFNPPGTSPLIEGLAVPEDFELPEGFMRHYQVTDDGEPLEAILMFSPDYEFHDADGNPISIPEDRVVPPELAPPGMPIRPIDPPP
jgi:hypothetical protein